MTQRPPFRTLLPAEASADSPDPGYGSQQSDSTLPPAAKRRLGVTTACSECRARKKKCDGLRPACSNCAARGVPGCLYSDPSDDPAAEILKLLRSLSLSRARAALSVLRSHSDEAAALALIKRAPPSPPLRPIALLSKPALVPLELELSNAYPNAYLKLPLIATETLIQSHLVTSSKFPADGTGSARQQSPLPLRFTGSGPQGDPSPGSTPPGPRTGDSIDDDSAVRQYRFPLSAGGKPANHLELCDERLRALDISFWTSVDVANDFAARVISLYLETDHPLLGLFDPDLFITDLVEHRPRYCSAFLVNALLYLGFQMYSALDKRASSFITPFWDEAERLRIANTDQESVCTMSAFVLMSLSLTGHGKNHTVIEFSKEANMIGQKLGFYNAQSVLAPKELVDMTDHDRMCCHAAWGSFNWSMILALFHRQPDVVVVNSPPAIPIPTQWSDSQSRKSAKVMPGSMPNHELSTTLPALGGATFSALCEFWRIIHGALWVYYPGKTRSPPEDVKLKLAEHKFREILAWTSQLPDMLTRGGERAPQVDVLHMWTHAALMDLLRPFTDHGSAGAERLTTFSAEDNSVITAYKASANQLKRLVLHYRTNHEASAYSILWHTGMLYLVNAMLERPRDPDWHTYFLLCIYGYENLRRPYLISEALAKSLLAMTLRKTDMSGEEARRILAEIEQGGLERVQEEIRAPFMGDLELALRDPTNASVEMTARLFEEMALFNEVLEQGVMDVTN